MLANLVQVLGGLAVFLLGIDMLSAGMEKLAGKRIQTWLDHMTDRPLKAAAFGSAATAILQSSSLLMVTMIGLINANLFTLEQAVSVMMGQEIGTTLTGQLIAFDIGKYLFALPILGYAMYGYGVEKRRRAWGQTLLGIGVVFLGLETMKAGIGPLTEQPWLGARLAAMGQNHLLGAVAGTVLTAVIQSSSAMTGLTIALGLSGAITLSGAISLILGANIGTCFMPRIALQQAAKELVRIGRMVSEMMTWSRTALLQTDDTAIQRVLDREGREIDPLCREAEGFVDRLMRGDLSHAEQQRCFQIKHLITDIERVADMTENLAQAGQERARANIQFSPAALTELGEFHILVSRVWALAVKAVETDDKAVAKLVKEGEEQIDLKERQLRDSHGERLESGICSPRADILFVETLRNLERIGDHADNLGVSVLRN